MRLEFKAPAATNVKLIQMLLRTPGKNGALQQKRRDQQIFSECLGNIVAGGISSVKTSRLVRNREALPLTI